MRFVTQRIAALQNLWNSTGGRKLMHNAGYLFLGQLATYALQILLVPYLLQTVGLEAFGRITLAQTVVNFVAIFSEYGFNLSATRQIAQDHDNANGVQKIVNEVLSAKCVLLLLSFGIIGLLVLTVPLYKQNGLLLFVTAAQMLGLTLFPLWLFQGKEQMKESTILQLAARLLFFAMVFVVVKSPADYLWVPICYSAGSIIAGAIALGYGFKKYNLTFTFVSPTLIAHQIKSNIALFASNAAINYYIYSSVIIGGFFLSSKALGYYGATDRILGAVRNLISVVFQATYPAASRFAHKSHAALRQFQKRVSAIYVALVLTGCIILFWLAPLFVLLLTKERVPEMIVLLRIVSFVPLVVTLNIPAYQTLVVYEQKRLYVSALALGSVFNFVFCLMGAYYFGVFGLAWAVFATECCITLLLWIFVQLRPHYRLFGAYKPLPQLKTDV